MYHLLCSWICSYLRARRLIAIIVRHRAENRPGTGRAQAGHRPGTGRAQAGHRPGTGASTGRAQERVQGGHSSEYRTGAGPTNIPTSTFHAFHIFQATHSHDTVMWRQLSSISWLSWNCWIEMSAEMCAGIITHGIHYIIYTKSAFMSFGEERGWMNEEY